MSKITFEERMNILYQAWDVFVQEEGLVVMTFKPAYIGIFTDKKALASEITRINASQVYTVLQIVKKAKLKMLPKNVLEKMNQGTGIATQDISQYRYLFVDVDVKGLRGEDGIKRNASREEHREAKVVVEEIIDFLVNKESFPYPMVLSSANGYHLVWNIEGKASTLKDIKIKRFLNALASKVDTENIHVDCGVYDRARKIKLPGSWNNEQISVGKRISKIISIPESYEAVSDSMMENVAKITNKQNGSCSSRSDDDERKPEEKIFDLAKNQFRYFYSTQNQVFATTKPVNGKTKTYPIMTSEFRQCFYKMMVKELGIRMLKKDVWSAVLEYAESMIDEKSEKRNVYNRIGMDKEKVIYYDLQNLEQQCVKIIPGEDYEIVNAPESMFYSLNMDNTQCMPKYDENFDFMKVLGKIFNLKDRDLELFAIWLISCYIPDANTPLLLLTGEQGVGKSSFSTMVGSLISPQELKKNKFPRKVDDLAVMLNGRKFIAFDNASYISEQQSNLLCQCITKGSYSKRSLYSDGRLYTIALDGIILINGIENFVERTDLLSRCLCFELQKPEKIMTDNCLQEYFEKYKPYLLDYIFYIVSEVMADTQRNEEEFCIRLAAFEETAIKIGRALFDADASYVRELLTQNKTEVDMESVESSPVVVVIREFMRNRKEWSGSVWDFYQELLDFATDVGLNNRFFPKSPSSFSKKMNSIATTLAMAGISFTKQKTSSCKKLIITNHNYKNRNKKTMTKVEDIDEELDFTESDFD